MAIQKPSSFSRTLAGVRPLLQIPSAQWRAGPFNLDVTVTDGAAFTLDLTTQDVWWGDAGVRKSYTLTNGSTTEVKATVHIESVELVITAGAFHASTPAQKDSIGDLYIEADVNGAAEYVGLFGAVTEQQTIITSSVAGTYTELEGGPKVLQQPIRCDMENNTLSLRADADLGIGSSPVGKLVIDGVLFPAVARVPGAIAGQCGTDVDAKGNKVGVDAVRRSRAERMTIANITRNRRR